MMLTPVYSNATAESTSSEELPGQDEAVGNQLLQARLAEPPLSAEEDTSASGAPREQLRYLLQRDREPQTSSARVWVPG